MGDVWASGEENVSVSKSRESPTCIGAAPLEKAEETKCGHSMEKLLQLGIGIVFSEVAFVNLGVFSELLYLLVLECVHSTLLCLFILTSPLISGIFDTSGVRPHIYLFLI